MYWRQSALLIMSALLLFTAIQTIQTQAVLKININMWMQPQNQDVLAAECAAKYNNSTIIDGIIGCNANYDSYVCWLPTLPGHVATQPCPENNYNYNNNYNLTRLAYRYCDENGVWLENTNDQVEGVGRTNYTECFPKIALDLLNQDIADSELKYNIGRLTWNMEYVGNSVSFVGLSASFWIFHHYRRLHNPRTHIHKCLIGTMLLGVTHTLIINGHRDSVLKYGLKGIHNAGVCKSAYILLEYCRECTTMWKMIEGIYLYHMVTGSARTQKTCRAYLYSIGWGIPAILTSLWTFLTGLHFNADPVDRCWFGYNFTSVFWIMQGPRLLVVLINFVILIKVLIIIYIKLRHDANSVTEKVRKAVRNALLLIPLFGLNTGLNMIQPPVNSNIWIFGLWTFTAHFLRSFQGAIISLFSCFLNDEVHEVIVYHYESWKILRATRRRLRAQSILEDALEMQQITQEEIGELKQNLANIAQANVSETEFGAENCEEFAKKTALEAVTATTIVQIESERTPRQFKARQENFERYRWSRRGKLNRNGSRTNYGTRTSRAEQARGPIYWTRQQHDEALRKDSMPYYAQRTPLKGKGKAKNRKKPLLRVTWSHPAKSIPNLPTVDTTTSVDQTEQKIGHAPVAPWMPRYHGLIVRNIQKLFNPQMVPPNVRRTPKKEPKLRVKFTPRPNVLDLSVVNYGASTSQENRGRVSSISETAASRTRIDSDDSSPEPTPGPSRYRPGTPRHLGRLRLPGLFGLSVFPPPNDERYN